MLSLLKRLFTSEKTVMLAILLMAIVIFLLSFPGVKNNPHSTYYCTLVHIDNFLVTFFILEAAIKIMTSGVKYFKKKWNLFDFVIVLISLPTLVSGVTSAIVVGRLLRLFRVMRFFTFIPHMDQLLTGLMRAFRASLFVLITLLTYTFVVAILNCNFFGHSDLFHDPIISFFTTFQLFTLEGWNEIPQKLIQNTSYSLAHQNLIRFYFIALVLTGGIFGLSIANAVFVDEMTIDNNIELEKKIDSLEKKIDDLKDILMEKK